MKKCPKCGNNHIKNGIFCSRSCANSRGPRTEEFKLNVSKKLRKKRYCKVCNKLLKYPRKNTCDKQCRDILAFKDRDYSNCGGYRIGSGRGKSGWYKGFFCDSSWELAYVIYNLDHNIKIERNTNKFSYIYEGTEKYYIPDFIIDDEYYEIKGYKSKQWEAKQDQFPHILNVLYKEDLKYIFDYIKKKYNISNHIEQLYDDYKPKYEYNCSHCNKIFAANTKRKTLNPLCSRKCSMLFNRKKD